MDDFRLRGILSRLLTVGVQLLAFSLYAGGSGLNTVVILNQNSSNSVALANYFCERRQVPPENVLRINWPGDNQVWTAADFQTNLLNPLQAMLAARQLTNQVDFIAISMDIPFATLNGTVFNGTTSGLFYGLKLDSGLALLEVTNSFAASEQPFRQAKPASAPGYSFLATMLTAGSLAQAQAMVDQGVNSDGTFPTQPVVLEKSSDAARNIRYHGFDNVVLNTRVRGGYAMVRTNSDSVAGFSNLLGFQTGLYQFTISPGTFVPGAMADSLTSYGGVIFGNNDQTSLLAFIHAGAAGSYGTVTEPTPNPDKFPNPQNYFYQARGFSLAECYYQSLVAPYQGLIVGEPLAAPFAVPASAAWLDLPTNSVLSGLVPMAVRFGAVSPGQPLQQVDLFVDGKYARTLTNIPPRAGNVLSLNLNGTAVTYTVPANATLGSVATGITALVNAPATTNLTKTVATVHGDRIELSSLPTNRLLAPMNLRMPGNQAPTNPAATGVPIASSSAGSGGSLTTFLSASRPTFLDSAAPGIKACNVSGILQVGTWLQIAVTTTNGARFMLAVTNQSISGTPVSLTTQLVSLINSTAALQGADGVIAEDLTTGWYDSASFNCRARSPGRRAAALKILLTCSSNNFVLTPPAESALDDEAYDLQGRNHLYVTAGVTNLYLGFQLDTTGLADGFHDLTAVAYEGTHVRTQARITLPIEVQNSPLNATLGFLDLSDPASAQATYHIQVTANTNNVTLISLLATGGQFAAATNKASATFTVDARILGVGLHPFYALVKTSAGKTYRTQPQWVRFGP